MSNLDRVRARRGLLMAATATAAVALGAGCADGRPAPDTAGRQAEVAERGTSVMPFDLERTTHRFTKTDTGGVQTVVADNPRDSAQITLIRQHLTAEVDRFRRGDFTDPARIHGEGMPGLDTLRAHAGRITIDYDTDASGARVTYTTSDTALRDALHHWFDAQISDHGRHASG